MLDKLKNNPLINPLHYSYYDQITNIPIKDWEHVHQHKNLFFSINYLSALESTLSDSIRFKYILFYQNDQAVGIAITQLLKVHTSALNFQNFPCKVSETLKNALLKSMDIKLLVCGNLFSCGEHGFLFTEHIPVKEFIHHLSKALLNLKKTEGSDKPSFILIKEFWPTSNYMEDYFKNYKFRDFSIDDSMVVSIHPSWSTFDAYLAMMKTKFRTRAKKVFKNSKEISIRNLEVADLAFYATMINKLYDAVLDKADFKIGKLDAATFKKLKETLTDSFICKGYFLKNDLVGFSTAFINQDAVEANHIGLDYEKNNTYDIYQRMLYDYVDLAITTGVKELRLGRTAETIKSAVGATPVAMQLYVRHSNSFSNKLLKPLVDFVSPREYEVRNPFKIMPD